MALYPCFNPLITLSDPKGLLSIFVNPSTVKNAKKANRNVTRTMVEQQAEIAKYASVHDNQSGIPHYTGSVGVYVEG